MKNSRRSFLQLAALAVVCVQQRAAGERASAAASRAAFTPETGIVVRGRRRDTQARGQTTRARSGRHRRCMNGRGRAVAMKQLEDSLGRLGTDHPDLWQVHEHIYDNDPDLHYASDGVLRALENAKRQGKVRFVGFTGHKHPNIHLGMIGRGFRVDTVQMPLNPLTQASAASDSRCCPLRVRPNTARR